MGYIEKNLDSNEKIVYETKLHWKIFILPILSLALAVYLYSIDWFWLSRIFAVGGGLSFIGMLIKYFTNEFVITTNNLRFRKGFFPETDRIPLNKITRVKLMARYNPIDILLDSGNMLVVVDGEDKVEFKGITSPKEFDNLITHQVNYPNSETQVIRKQNSKDFYTRLHNVISQIPGPKKSAEIIADLPIDIVWKEITNSHNFNSVFSGFSYWEEFDAESANEGTKFKRGYDDYYIVNWKKPYHFSIGSKPTIWDHDFRLEEVDNKTKITYVKRWNVLGYIAPSQSDANSTLENFKSILDEIKVRKTRKN